MQPLSIPLPILYRDEFLVAIDKPAGMLVHPTRDPEPPEHIAMKCLRDQLGQRVFPAHRLDRPTSGALLFALDKKTAATLQQAFQQQTITKHYLAIVPGKTPPQWTCNTPLRANPEDKALPASTSFQRIATTEHDPSLTLSLLKITPLSGRFHQIRRHLLEAGFPIAGDFRYAGMERSYEICGKLNIGTRMLLQSAALQFTHPHSDRELKITAPPDPDFLKCFASLAAIDIAAQLSE